MTTKACPDCGRPKARNGAAWNRDHCRAMPENSPTCGRHLGSFWIDDSLPDCKEAELDRLRARVAEGSLGQWAVRCLDAHMRKHAREHMGSGLEVGVSGNGENWNASLAGAQFVRSRITHSLAEALLNEARAIAAADKSLPQPPEGAGE